MGKRDAGTPKTGFSSHKCLKQGFLEVSGFCAEIALQVVISKIFWKKTPKTDKKSCRRAAEAFRGKSAFLDPGAVPNSPEQLPTTSEQPPNTPEHCRTPPNTPEHRRPAGPPGRPGASQNAPGLPGAPKRPPDPNWPKSGPKTPKFRKK